MQPTNYTIKVKVKPYVKQYLINNCGNPVDLTHLPKLKRIFTRLIQKPLFHETLDLSDGDCCVNILISEDTFTRHGWELDRKAMMYFNSEVANDLKFVMRNYISAYSAFYPITTSIKMFQERFNFPEEVWAFDTIKKDIDRNTEVKRSEDVMAFVKMMDRKINKLFVDNLSEVGTISKQYRNELSKI